MPKHANTYELMERTFKAELALVTAEANARILTDRNERLEEDNKKLALALEQAQAYIQSNPGYIQNVMDLMEKYQHEVLQELPLPVGQTPEWLTPGEDVPVTKESE